MKKDTPQEKQRTQYEMRVEMLKRAFDFFEKKYECDLIRYEKIGGDYPIYPSVDDCLKYSEMMKRFVNKKSI